MDFRKLPLPGLRRFLNRCLPRGPLLLCGESFCSTNLRAVTLNRSPHCTLTTHRYSRPYINVPFIVYVTPEQLHLLIRKRDVLLLDGLNLFNCFFGQVKCTRVGLTIPIRPNPRICSWRWKRIRALWIMDGWSSCESEEKTSSRTNNTHFYGAI